MFESLRNIEFTRSRLIITAVVVLVISCVLCGVGGFLYNVAFGPMPAAEQPEVSVISSPAGTAVLTPTLPPPRTEIPTWTPTATATRIRPTSTPIPIYTPTPTDTPPPTDTPLPTNTPPKKVAPAPTAAQPQQTSLSAEELAYANAFLSQAKRWEESHTRSMSLLSVTKPSDYTWKLKFDEEMNAWQGLISEAQALKAPSRFQEFNTRYQGHINLYIKAKDQLIEGVTDIQEEYDLSTFNLGMDAMLTAQKHIHDMNDEMKGIRGS